MKNTFYFRFYCFLFYCSLVIGFTSCETLVNDIDPSRLPSGETKLTAFGFISPQDTVLSVRIGFTAPAFGQRLYNQSINPNNPASLQAFYDKYTVSISNGSQSAALKFNIRTNNFEASAKSLPIIAGRTYFLKITDADNKIYEASCNVPQAVPITSWKLDSVPSNRNTGNNNNLKDKVVQFSWQDPAGQENYYRLGGYWVQSIRSQNSNGTFTENLQTSWLSFESGGGRRGTRFVSDNKLDGTRMESGISRVSATFWSSNATITTRSIEYYLIHCDKSYYDYHRIADQFDDDNPFVEPTLVPSNIKGGLGCFGGYNRSNLIVR